MLKAIAALFVDQRKRNKSVLEERRKMTSKASEDILATSIAELDRTIIRRCRPPRKEELVK